jgi:hypothetical protein
MADMSLKQAKEIADRLELAELSLTSLLANSEKATKLFEDTLKEQKQILSIIPKMDNKLNMMKVLVGINIGFIVGLVVAKYFL